jgi:hypothetical protein
MSPVPDEAVPEMNDYMVDFSFGNFSAFPSNESILQMTNTNLCKCV